jgi:hypothetical protein
MPKPKDESTWPDYLAVGVAPVFIMALVGSLCFFLLDIGYDGQYAARLRWILFWFVFGSVMLARVSITQGVAHAGLLGAGLGLATALAVVSFVSPAIVGCLLIALIWWCAHKLTWNCTFIDDTVDPSAAGLLETAGQDDRLADRRIGTRSAAERVHDPLSDDTFRAEEAVRLKNATWWKRAWRSLIDLEPKAHAPGLSVLYFSLAALPLFGFGQWLIPAGADDRQSSAFRWLMLYLASGLSLLLITSFLGLRRYLRRRSLEMPAAMTTSWIGVGGAMIVALLLGALLLPIPSARNDWSVAVRDRLLTSPEREASQVAPLKTEGTQSDDPDASQTPDGQRPKDPSQPPPQSSDSGGAPSDQATSGQSDSGENQNGQPSAGNGDQQQQSSDGNQSSDSQSSQSQGDQQPENQQQNDAQDGNQSSQSQSQQPNDDSQKQNGGAGADPQSQSNSKTPSPDSNSQQSNPDGSSTSAPSPPAHPPATPPATMPSLSWLRPLFWIALAVIVLVAAVIYRHQLIALLREIAEIWRGLWQIIFPRKAKSKDDAPPIAKPPFQPFAAFSNPFLDGRAQRASTDELVKYTFAALEAWAYEHGEAHRAEETPLEFTTRIAATFAPLSAESTRLGAWLARTLYARQLPPSEAKPTLESLWQKMQSTRPALTTTTG